jgi:hypothetical protein
MHILFPVTVCVCYIYVILCYRIRKEQLLDTLIEKMYQNIIYSEKLQQVLRMIVILLLGLGKSDHSVFHNQ